MYSSFLLWLLSELFENLSEVGALDRPKLVFFFDEAHLLFDDAPPALRQRIEQVVRLIRSKGVGVYFCSQFPDDVLGEILGQLGNRIQHALRAYTPRDQKAVRTAAQTFVANDDLDVAEVIARLAVGEALVSTLEEKGVPTPVEHTLICPPRCRMGAVSAEEREAVRSRSSLGAKYDAPVNRESAYEILNRRAVQEQATETAADSGDAEKPEERGMLGDLLWGSKRRQGLVETMAKQAARTVGSQDRPQDHTRSAGRHFGRLTTLIEPVLTPLIIFHSCRWAFNSGMRTAQLPAAKSRATSFTVSNCTPRQTTGRYRA